ncbi:MAG: hypothetical protein AB7F64_05530 [Gammaproteobacteria bacterium]
MLRLEENTPLPISQQKRLIQIRLGNSLGQRLRDKNQTFACFDIIDFENTDHQALLVLLMALEKERYFLRFTEEQTNSDQILVQWRNFINTKSLDVNLKGIEVDANRFGAAYMHKRTANMAELQTGVSLPSIPSAASSNPSKKTNMDDLLFARRYRTTSNLTLPTSSSTQTTNKSSLNQSKKRRRTHSIRGGRSNYAANFSKNEHSLFQNLETEDQPTFDPSLVEYKSKSIEPK